MPNVLPHNPLTSVQIFEEVKKVKGDKMGWLEFDLRCLTVAYPTNKVFTKALAEAITPKAEPEKKAAPVTPAEPAKKGTKASDATTKQGNTRGRKTAAEVKEAAKAPEPPAKPSTV